MLFGCDVFTLVNSSLVMMSLGIIDPKDKIDFLFDKMDDLRDLIWEMLNSRGRRKSFMFLEDALEGSPKRKAKRKSSAASKAERLQEEEEVELNLHKILLKVLYAMLFAALETQLARFS